MSKKYSVDWEKFDAITDEDVLHQISEDADLSPELNAAFWEKAHLRIPDDLDVKSVRKRTSLSQVKFANLYGFSVRTLQKWEAGERRPNKAARVLLHLINYNPTFMAIVAHKASTDHTSKDYKDD
jgi:putative transcriptional regulator